MINHFHSTLVRFTIAGTPATNVFGGTSFVTTAPAATIAPSPMVTPLNMVAPTPIQTLSPIIIGAVFLKSSLRIV